MSETQEIIAIVVGYTDYGESDRIARLLSPQLGLISVMGRAARASKHRMAGVIDLGNKIRATILPGKGEIWSLKNAVLEHGYLPIRSDIHKLALMSYCCEISSRFAPPGMAAPKIFGLLEHTLCLLEQEQSGFGSRFRNGFELKLLSFAGLQPTLSTCACCGEPASATMVYSVASSGAAHRHCASENTLTVTTSWLQELEHCLHTPLLESIMTPPLNEPQWVLALQIEHHTETALRSRSFLASLEASV